MRVIIFGGYGFIGSNLIELLGDNPQISHITLPIFGDNIHIPSRIKPLIDSDKLSCTSYNPQSQESINHILEGHDLAVNLIGIPYEYNRYALQELGSKFFQLPNSNSIENKRDGMRNFNFTHNKLVGLIAGACRTARTHLIHISAQGANSKSACRYLASKGRGEEHVASLTNWTLVRPGVVLEEDALFVRKMRRLARLLPVMPLPLAKSRQQPVTLKDLLDLLSKVIEKPMDYNQATLNSVGDKEMTMTEIIRQVANPRWIIPVPSMFNLPMALAAEMIMRNPIITRDNLRAANAYQPVTSSANPIQQNK
ncbi:MAG: hypothetical protein HAW61_03940 [Candidatus Portiera sp.]|nr:hypothetical protein [Portiera sp.]